jgi:hypothetical protein
MRYQEAWTLCYDRDVSAGRSLEPQGLAASQERRCGANMAIGQERQLQYLGNKGGQVLFPEEALVGGADGIRGQKLEQVGHRFLEPQEMFLGKPVKQLL